ncbi:hypothetical protein AX15_002305 [Amanita polypyramis BW_CC]|nr:hypothetical protein AX15_002305 [Amanita polypyramis BW_CC]
MSIAHASALDVPALTDSLKKKKKRRRSDGTVQFDDPSDHRKDRKKRKKHSQEILAADVAPAITVAEPLHKKKLKKKDKAHKTVSDASAPVADPQVNTQANDASSTNAQASAAALLSTIVAAATGAPDLPQMAINPDMMNTDQHYLHYSPLHYGLGTNPQFTSQQPGQMFSPPINVPFSELTFGCNEDVLRALQDIDISKIANVLKTLEDAATAANVPLPIHQPPPVPPSPSSNAPRATPLGQVPVPSNAIIANASISSSQESSRRQATTHQTTPDHAYLLAHKWLNASKLSELVKTEGLIYKKGKFSATEEQQLKAAIENYRVAKGLSEEQLLEIIFPKNEKNRDNAFWSEITAAVPQRPIIAVYHHTRRSHHPLKQQGKWAAEEDALLRQAVADVGQQWEKVSERVGRMSADCRDRYRNHIVNREIRVAGPWTKEEEDQLIRIVTRMTVEQGKDLDNEVFWGRVSEEMGGKRGRQQCRIKWTDALSKTVKNEGQKPRWSVQDAYILIHKIDSLDVNDDTEIDWKTLPDPAWNLWSAHTLQRRWLTMKRSVPHFENLSHQGVIDL